MGVLGRRWWRPVNWGSLQNPKSQCVIPLFSALRAPQPLRTSEEKVCSPNSSFVLLHWSFLFRDFSASVVIVSSIEEWKWCFYPPLFCLLFCVWFNFWDFGLTLVSFRDMSQGVKGGPVVPESVLKKRKRDEEWALAEKQDLEAAKKKNAENRKLIFNRAKLYAKEYDEQQKELIRLKREAKLKGGFYVDPEAKLLFIIRIRGWVICCESLYFGFFWIVVVSVFSYVFGFSVSMLLTQRPRRFCSFCVWDR